MALGAKPTLSVQYCDDPQLTSVSELSEQKLGLVTLTTCRLISAAALRKNTRTQTAARGARGRCRRQKVRRTFTFSSMFSLSLWPRNRSAVGLAAAAGSRHVLHWRHQGWHTSGRRMRQAKQSGEDIYHSLKLNRVIWYTSTIPHDWHMTYMQDICRFIRLQFFISVSRLFGMAGHRFQWQSYRWINP